MTKISDLYGMLPDAFSLDSAKKSLKDRIGPRSINRIIKGYMSEKLLVKLKNGHYAKASADIFAVANFVYRGYIGFSSALYLHGLKTELEDTITVCTGELGVPVYFMEVRILPVHFSELLYGTALVNGAIASTYPKTLFDMLYKPKYSSFFDFYRALNQKRPSEEEWRELFGYAKDANLATRRRAGYALERFAPRWFLKELSGLDSGKGKSFFSKKVSENFSKRWLIYDSSNIKRWENAV